MPIGPYKDWAACLTGMQNKGYSKKESEKICGKMEQEAKESDSKQKASNWFSKIINKAENNENN